MKKPRKSLGEGLFDELCRDIVQGRIEPGSNILPERKLSEARGLNRGAVREAMKRLAQMRLIHIVHGGGNRVNDWREEAGLELLAELLVTDPAELVTTTRKVEPLSVAAVAGVV